MKTYLTPVHDSRKSFYNKAVVEGTKLYSYNTLVAEFIDLKPHVYDIHSATTLRHVKEWLKQGGHKAETKKQILEDYGV